MSQGVPGRDTFWAKKNQGVRISGLPVLNLWQGFRPLRAGRKPGPSGRRVLPREKGKRRQRVRSLPAGAGVMPVSARTLPDWV